MTRASGVFSLCRTHGHTLSRQASRTRQFPVQLIYQFRITSQCGLKDCSLPLRQRHIAALRGFGQAWQLEMCVSLAAGIQEMLVPWAPGDAAGGQPIAFDTYYSAID